MPWCAKCNKPVEKLTRRIDFWSGNLMWIAECHGSVHVHYEPCPHDLQELTAF